MNKLRNVNQILISCIFIFLGIVCNSCKNETGDNIKIEADNVRLSLSADVENSRTILPCQDISDLICLVIFKATKKGETSVCMEKCWNSITAFKNDEDTFLSEGIYSCVLELYTLGDEYCLCQKGELKDISISKNNYFLRFSTVFVNGTGSLDLMLNWSNSIVCKTVGTLFEIDGETQVFGFEAEKLEVRSENELCYSQYSKTEVPTGSYYIKIALFDSNDIEVYTYFDVIKIYSGLCTEKIVSADNVNSICNIKYHLSDGEFFIDDYTPPEILDENITVILPDKDKIYRKHYKFAGWYKNNQELVKSVTVSDASDDHYIHLNARWEKLTEYKMIFESPYRVNDVSYYSDDEKIALPSPYDSNEIISFCGWYTKDYKTKIEFINNEILESLDKSDPYGYSWENTINVYLYALCKIDYENLTNINSYKSYIDEGRVNKLLVYSDTATSFDTRIQADFGSLYDGKDYGDTSLWGWWKHRPHNGVMRDYYIDLTGMTKLEKIEDLAFCQCTRLRKVVLPETVTTIGEGAFGSTGLKEITIPQSVKNIGQYAFRASGIEKVSIKDGVECDLSHVFYDCTKLVDITIPSSIKTIGESAFNGCTGLTEIEIPNSVTTIGYDAFHRCTGLTEINIPNSITSIETSVFSCCTGLTEINIPKSVTYLSGFNGCTGLTKIIIPNSVKSIGDNAFSDCTGLTEVEIPDSVTSIGGAAFRDCTGITEITIPNSVKSIGEGAFSGCTGITEITIPDSVKSIGEGAFSGCTGITEVTIPDSVSTIEDSTFRDCTVLAEVTIPESITSIKDLSFYDCKGLTKVEIPDSVSSIGWGSFGGCIGITEITIPDSVKSIGWAAFSGCTGLIEIIIPAGLEEMGAAAFSGDTKLKTIIFKGTCQQWKSINFEERDGKHWDYGLSASKVICSDGEVEL